MIHSGYAIITADGQTIRTFGSMPTYIAWPDGARTEPAIIMDYIGWKFVERWTDIPEETRTQRVSDEIAVFSDGKLVVSATLIDKTEEEIAVWDAGHIPAPVSSLRFRLALLNAGLLDSVENYVSEAPRNVRLAWEFHGECEFDNPLVKAAAAALGVNDATLRGLFALAAASEPGR